MKGLNIEKLGALIMCSVCMIIIGCGNGADVTGDGIWSQWDRAPLYKNPNAPLRRIS